MNVAILVPARFASSRYPGKPLAELRGASGTRKPLIQRSFEAAMRVHSASSVHVVTDDERIARAAAAFGAQVIMTSEQCRNGTERCAEALAELDSPDIVVNLQGDALLTPPEFVDALVEKMRQDTGARVATPAIRLSSTEVRALQAAEAAGRVGATSLVTDQQENALYFSKRLIPHLPESALSGDASPIRMHVGVYAYRPEALRKYARTPPAEIELLEGLEQLRFLFTGVPVSVVEVNSPKYPICELNNPEDVPEIERSLALAGID